jgi:glucokinase
LVRSRQEKRFVVVTGVPGSGKSWLANKLEPLLRLKVIDKDDFLEELFAVRGVGDATWRRALSRESDQLFEREARHSEGAFLVSFWHQRGMNPDSGTPTAWLAELPAVFVTLRCECPAEIAAARFRGRKRHAGHLDDSRSFEDILMAIRHLARLEPVHFGEIVSVDTSVEVSIEGLAHTLAKAFERATTLARCERPEPLS